MVLLVDVESRSLHILFMVCVTLEEERLPLCCCVVNQTGNEIIMEESLRYAAMTGLSEEQLTEVVARVHAARGRGLVSRGRPYALGLFASVTLVVALLRTNLTQQVAGEVFGVSQPTVSQRWDLLRPLIGQVLARFVPDLRQVAGAGTVLVDGTVSPTWDWRHRPDLYSVKAGYPRDEPPDRRHPAGAPGSGGPGPGTRMPTPPPACAPPWPACPPWPIWAMSVSRASTSSRSSISRVASSRPVRPSSTPP